MSATTVSQEGSPSISTIFISSLLVLGNVLGVGVLALPISAGLGGFIPALFGIVLVWCMMLFAAWLIAYRIDENKKNFDIPSFFKDELGTTAKWIAIACNLLILYGVLVAYLSGISTMMAALYSDLANYQYLITIIYFCIVVSLIVFGLGIMRKGMSVIMIVLWVCFFIMCYTGLADWQPKLLTYMDWKYLPICLPIAVSAFHFHNIIPTVSKSLNYNKPATYKAIFIGVFLGLIINLGWVVVVLGSMHENNAGVTSVVYAEIHNLTANVPMTEILHNSTFEFSALIFALLSVTCSFMANGAGLFGFITDLCTDYLKTENKLLISVLAFAPPLIIALVYPEIFLVALSLVGGVGEDVLFALLPGVIIIKIAHSFIKKHEYLIFNRWLVFIGWIMVVLSAFVLLYVLGQKFGLINMAPPPLKM
jgi:tyrosine-specific transport protein